MSAQPPVVTQEEIFRWYEIDRQLKLLKAEEAQLREKIFNAKFQNPREGTNNLDMEDGWVMKGGYVINRSIDPGALEAYKDQFAKADIWTEQVIEYKPNLKIARYRELTDDQRKLFDHCLIIKPGMPSLQIVLPARRTPK